MGRNIGEKEEKNNPRLFISTYWTNNQVVAHVTQNRFAVT
jgi:hypothetical protein